MEADSGSKDQPEVEQVPNEKPAEEVKLVDSGCV